MPNILVAIAHPDDEANFAATLYVLTNAFNYLCDFAVFTNGESGFRYSLLAEAFYQIKLTQQNIAKEHLATIRKSELEQSAKILGVRNLYYFNLLDTGFTKTPNTLFAASGDTNSQAKWCEARINRILHSEKYDLVITLFPSPLTHGHHQDVAAFICQQITKLPPEQQCPILGALDFNLMSYMKKNPSFINASTNNIFYFNKQINFGHNKNLSLNTVVNWVIASHKSQGTLQNYTNKFPHEIFHLLNVTEKNHLFCEHLFKELNSDSLLDSCLGNSASSPKSKL